MPLVLIVLGLLLVVAGARGKIVDLIALLKDDSKGFLVYIVVIGAVGMLGYFDKARPVANAFLALIMVALILGSGRQFATQFSGAIK